MEDKRFAHIVNDPKFRQIPKGERKVKIDKRFQSMFKDKQFKVKYTVDKRGRPVNQTSTEDLKRYYHLSSEDEDSDSSSSEVESSDIEEYDQKIDEKTVKEDEPGKFVKVKTGKDKTDLSSLSENGTKVTKVVKKKLKNLKVDYARGESNLFSESSSDDEESKVEEEEVIDHKWGELDGGVDTTEDISCRLAACNMDWDRIRATDIMVLLNSFLPPGGAIKSVAIYPSEFGKERMKEEEMKGPPELVEIKLDSKSEETEEGSKYHMEKLRQYQLNRLKYYYAVIVFDSEASSNKIYTECDGMEYESSATKIDLRFIPNDMTFDDEPKEVCDKLPELSKYQPRFFTTTALQQAKVELTWDETDPNRVEMTQKLSSGKLEDINESDLHNYVAVSSEEGSENEDAEASEDDGNPIEKYKTLLQDIEDKEKEKEDKEVQMEVKWGLGLKQKTDGMIKKKLTEKADRTPFQQYIEKRKEKRKEKKKKRQQNSESEDDISDIDMSNPYFAEEFANGDFKQKSKKKEVRKTEEVDEKTEGELELLLMKEDNDNKHFSLKKIQDNENDTKSKRKKKNKIKQDAEPEDVQDFEVDVSDARFSAIFTSHHYNIDPTDSHFKKTKGMEKLIGEKLKRKNIDEDVDKSGKRLKNDEGSNKKDAELSVLVKSIKRKTEAFNTKNK